MGRFKGLERPRARTSLQQAEQMLNAAMQQLHCGHAKASIQLLVDDAYLRAIETNGGLP
jgi:hypothetical protein